VIDVAEHEMTPAFQEVELVTVVAIAAHDDQVHEGFGATETD
jgi:hypothetical protein